MNGDKCQWVRSVPSTPYPVCKLTDWTCPDSCIAAWTCQGHRLISYQVKMILSLKQVPSLHRVVTSSKTGNTRRPTFVQEMRLRNKRTWRWRAVDSGVRLGDLGGCPCQHTLLRYLSSPFLAFSPITKNRRRSRVYPKKTTKEKKGNSGVIGEES